MTVPLPSATVLRDPTAGRSGPRRDRVAPRRDPRSLTVALLDIGKTRSDEFIDALVPLLAARGLSTRRYRKPTNTKPATPVLLQTIAAECQAAVVALSD
jgi:hypothetical protein